MAVFANCPHGENGAIYRFRATDQVDKDEFRKKFDELFPGVPLDVFCWQDQEPSWRVWQFMVPAGMEQHRNWSHFRGVVHTW